GDAVAEEIEGCAGGEAALAVAVEVGGGRGRPITGGQGRGPQVDAEVVVELVAGEDLDVAVVVEVGEGDRPGVGRGPAGRRLPVHGAVVFERARGPADARGDDLGQAVA